MPYLVVIWPVACLYKYCWLSPSVKNEGVRLFVINRHSECGYYSFSPSEMTKTNSNVLKMWIVIKHGYKIQRIYSLRKAGLIVISALWWDSGASFPACPRPPPMGAISLGSLCDSTSTCERLLVLSKAVSPESLREIRISVCLQYGCW